MQNVLLLGGTTEATALARLLADRDCRAVLSYAGRTEKPVEQAIPVRIGGFGGAEGLRDYLATEGITHLVDATHPFAAQISANALSASKMAGIPYIALTRPPWQPVEGDNWSHVGDIVQAVDALAGPPRRIMLALGRMHVEAFAAQPQHHYLLRFVDAAPTPPSLPHHDIVVDRGPFTVGGDIRLMKDHSIDLIVSKNAGGTGAQAKLIAARQLGLPVLMIDRPFIARRNEVHRAQEVINWLDAASGHSE